MTSKFDRQLRAEISGLWFKAQSPKRPLYLAGELVRNSILENFKVEGRPESWDPSMRALMTGGQTLSKSGRLKGSIDYRVEESGVVFFSDVIYAATHNFGDPERNIPQRQFMMFQKQDIDEIKKIFRDFILE